MNIINELNKEVTIISYKDLKKKRFYISFDTEEEYDFFMNELKKFFEKHGVRQMFYKYYTDTIYRIGNNRVLADVLGYCSEEYYKNNDSDFKVIKYKSTIFKFD